MASDLRFLLTVLRIVPELERSADLAEHIAQRAAGPRPRAHAPVRGLIEQMGRSQSRCGSGAADAYADRDAEAADRLTQATTSSTTSTCSLTPSWLGPSSPLPVAIEMALIGPLLRAARRPRGQHRRHVRYLAAGT